MLGFLGIARLCCDTRRQVRSQALTYLQRALLVHDLQALTPTEWENCFNKVISSFFSSLKMRLCDVTVVVIFIFFRSCFLSCICSWKTSIKTTILTVWKKRECELRHCFAKYNSNYISNSGLATIYFNS